jgi:hypothetical protein
VTTVRALLRRLASVTAFALVVLGAGAADATPSARLLYVRNAGTETCPDEGEFRKAVAARLGYDPFFPWAPTTVIATLDRAGAAYHGEIVVLDERSTVLGRRKIDARSGDCVELARTMGLAVSVALDDLDLGAEGPVHAHATPPPAPPEPPEMPPRLAPVATPPPRSEVAAASVASASTGVPIVLSASLGALVSLGVAPSPSVGATLSFRARRRWLSVVLEGRADLPSSKGYYGGSVSTNVLGGSLLACAHPFRGLYGCGVGFLASFGEQGSGYAPNGSGTALFFAAGARVGWEVGLGARLFLDLRVDGMLSPTANAVSVEGMPAYAMPVESGSAGVGLGTRF